MNKRVLITFATRRGSTAEIAEAISEALHDSDLFVDICLIQDNPDPSRYDAVIVGSCIRAGQWLPEALEFVDRHHDVLNDIPTAFFTVCLTMSDDTPQNRETIEGYMRPLRDLVEPIEVGLFAGALDYSKLSFPTRLFLRMNKTPEGDFRNWSLIRAWAQDLRPALLQI